LTESTGLSPELGTRHRAGIGVTEESDAIVVIVSEERGEVSLAVHGQIHRQLDPTGLASLLRQLLAERPVSGTGPAKEPVELKPK
ncbi:MAG: DNA integrity scanning protein DisA nucleotide-binding domain protein, partial [Armatimonadetes bacterium]|nr:DNA integrity scanning protein DisA nucleotide-binding domain protein [Armatimonadota bacterium]